MTQQSSVFSLALKVLEFYGIYQPEATKWSIRRGIFMFFFIVLQFLCASIYRLFFVGDLNEFILAIVYVIFSANLTIKALSFVRNQEEILDIIDDLEILHSDVDSVKVKKDDEKIYKLVLGLLLSEVLIGFNLSLMILVMSNQKVYTIPLLYYPESNIGYYLMFFVHYLQIFGIGTLMQG